ncbi:MAG: Na+/H+ antiporter NhaA, partial [Chloroflexota bacterium]
VFFFVVGLEIKRELLVGELKSRRSATLPIAGALGGMVVPALIFLVLNAGSPAARGWGIPMATDIAFALGILALLGSRVGLPLKIFLLALAIVDDLGAVLVIAVFYTDQLDVLSLLLAGAAWAGALAYGRYGAARPLGYALIGAVMWYFMLKSGVHATVAGVLMAVTVPLRHTLTSDELQEELQPVLGQQADGFEEVEVAIERLEGVLDRAHSPLHSMEHALTPIVAFVIMPIFAFFNAGVAIAGGDVSITGAVSVGVLLGLIVGKPVGILLFASLAVRSGLTDLPDGATWMGMIGVALLAGIGFTMSLFIAGLAFGPGPALDEAKLGILAASVVAAVVGLVFLSRSLPRDQPT